MIESLIQFAQSHREATYLLLRRLFAESRTYLLQSDLVRIHDSLCRETERADLADAALRSVVCRMEEAILVEPWAYFTIRESVATWHYLRIHFEQLALEPIEVADYLRFKEACADVDLPPEETLEIDFGPFNREFPKLKDARSIGQGMTFLNRQLASRLFSTPAEAEGELLRFLSLHAIDGQSLMLQTRFDSGKDLRGALRQGLAWLEWQDPSKPWAECSETLRKLGFAAGWGDTAGRIDETMSLLQDILEAPAAAALEAFLARIPMISRLLILSPHGYFGQANVLGRPDTGGQVVYILDQARALEREMRERLVRQGVEVEPKILIATRLIPDAQGTTCYQRLEKVAGCRNTWILRVPFRKTNGEIVPQWISRFAVWPYLERFSRDVEHEVLGELGGRPDMIIGNYSDGNLVASLLGRRLGVTQCNIAHALEKTKYLYSALYWRHNEERYHFACQYTADLIAMNSADFIITSTHQEIAGTANTIGQYESYCRYTMPGLYRVLNGIELYDPKFNIVSPGADAEVYFPYSETDRRLRGLWPEIEALIYGEQPPGLARGSLTDKAKPLIFSLARLDCIKNLTGLIDCFGASPRLRRYANLLVIGGSISQEGSDDYEERAQIQRMHELMDHHRLDEEVRWLGVRLDKNMSGELYRYVADGRGIFVQPALFEAFGLTVIEAMASGLPTFATCHGGPSEIIQHKRSGFHIDPNDGVATADVIADFLEHCAANPREWDRISTGALARIEQRYTWKIYAERLMTLARIFGFWKYVSDLERQETRRYLDMFYHLQFRPLARAIQHE
ncbi:sucrose synthase [Methylococcus sp. EFPC2]|uniref:sucrose synthase n=1 Tax=Methylococcus sp. EFPC2 TaxID=2812648 RepID=UPI001967930C|nr:sucrose synthase [Methylococcus sp. EFPC2]QSA97482.1 sucrose synthase [Methylococcus sp. EFPC2]